MILSPKLENLFTLHTHEEALRRKAYEFVDVELHLKLTQVLHLKVTHLEEPEYGSSVLGFSSFCLLGFLRRAVFEAVAIVAGFNDVAVMSQPVE